MKKFSIAVPILLAFAPVFLAHPALAAPQTPECAAVNPTNGEGKFTGQISGSPNGSIFDVTSGAQSVTVLYNNSVLVCQGGQPASVNSLVLGANVVVYGPIRKKGKAYQMTATKILVAGPPVGALRSGNPENFNNSAAGRVAPPPANNFNPSMNPPAGTVYTGQNRGGSTTATDDWNSPTGGSAQGGNQQAGGSQQGGGYAQGGGYSQVGSTISGQDSWSAGDSKGRVGSQNTISCNALEFSMKGGTDAATGKAMGRASASGITCKRPVDQLALQLFQDDATGRRLGNVTLNWQNQLEVLLTNAEVSTMQFAPDTGGQQVVEITFAYQRAEVVYLPSNTRVTF